jgi:uncharacterized membrane protein YkvA (DUF1232 family)
MSDEYHLDITEEVTSHFKNILLNVATKDEDEILSSLRETLNKLNKNKAQSYVKKHLETLENLVQMFSDNEWKMINYERHYILSALQYLIEEDDVIPDNIPGVGLLDDCIMIDIVAEKLKVKLQAYNEFKCAASIYAQNDKYSTSDWSNTKRMEVDSRLRHRRMSYSQNRYR